VVHRLIRVLSIVVLLGGGIVLSTSPQVAAQQAPASAKPSAATAAPTPSPTPVKIPPAEKANAAGKNVTAEAVVEWVIAIYGGGIGRPVLDQVRRNGNEQGEIVKISADGRTETANYSWRFIRGASGDKDKIRVDQKSPTLEYALVFNAGQTFGIMNGAAFVPRQEATDSFLNQQRRGLDALLRYKENESSITLLNREKQKGLDLYVVEVTDKEKRHTRYYISSRTLRVLWLEYEEPGAAGTPVNFVKKFSDYRYAQNTLIPKHTELFEDGKQTQEMTIKTITYGVRMDDALFQHPDNQTSSRTP